MSDVEPISEDEPEPEAWPGDDLEAAYLRALEANEVAEWEIAHLPESEEEQAPDTELAAAVDEPVDATSDASTEEPAEPDEKPSRITIRQVIEAALFVGGDPLTSKKLCYMLHGDYDLDAIDDAIDELNHLYLDEGRPYGIRLGEGGYRLVLRHDFEPIRNRVYGVGPREVKLSQDVLEVLALVAYRQPITPEEIEELGKSNSGPMLRQLLRRELISLERDAEDRKRVTYATTKRFLSVFGIGSIEELPQADELAFK